MKPAGKIPLPTLLAVTGGVLWIGFHLWLIVSGVDPRRVRLGLLVAAVAVALMGLSTFRAARLPGTTQYARSGPFVLLAGMGLVILGLVVTAFRVWDASWLLAVAGEILTTVGLAAFTITMLAGPPRAAWKFVPLLMAPIYLASWGLEPDAYPPWLPAHPEHWAAVLYGLGWVAFGLLLPGSSGEA